MQKQYAVVFPGQGSQSLGMLSSLASRYSEIQQTFEEASSILKYDLWRLVTAGPVEHLNQTAYTQPLLLAGGFAVWRILQKHFSFVPIVTAGHSLGEYTALLAASVFSFEDALKLVAHRGQWMQEAVPEGSGAMAAILGLEAETIAAICKAITTDDAHLVAPANFNMDGQVVIAGHTSCVTEAMQAMQKAGAKKVILLPVSVPSHCLLMKPASEKLHALLKTMTLNAPTLRVINNVDVRPYVQPTEIIDGLTRQLYCPVRWVEVMQAFRALSVTHVIECGPGKVLTGLGKRIEGLAWLPTCELPYIESLENEQ